MPSNFPTSLDALTNPLATDALDGSVGGAAVFHDVQHANVNDIVEALEAKVGIDSSAVATSHDYKIAKLATHADWLGSGGNGALTFDGTTTIMGIAPSSNVYTFTKPIFASSITVNSGVTLQMRGQRIVCSGAMVVNGTIHCNGTIGPNATGSTGQATSADVNGEFGSTSAANSGVAGESGTTSQTPGNASNGQDSTLSPGGGSGGGGGGGDDAGGSNGTSGVVGTRTGPIIAVLAQYLTGYATIGIASVFVGRGGRNGARGAGDGTNSGGGGGCGGNGGCCLVVAASSLTVAASGVISADGGAGGNGGVPPAGNCGGGGGAGGGGGGIVVLAYKTLTNSGTISAAGGAAGTGGAGIGTGTTGSNGTAGQAGTVLKYNFTTGAWE